MKDYIITILAITISIIMAFIAHDYLNTQYDRIEIQRDTVIITATDYQTMKQRDSLYHIVDSIQILNSKLEEELNIALFKIDRIKEYNRIAGNGNNIKYLRGWINRTLNEN